ncbi:MAG: 2-hydroxyacyl-CoA dehydratase [Planctomycetaceae bacterium]|jgi:predicted nucleotide-binding protein (sugar kinase/HSP70/actin superfamily)|nr:2-hydroxyacyl-CoA dehydratase [Planctomycetaceae bacterium]
MSVILKENIPTANEKPIPPPMCQPPKRTPKFYADDKANYTILCPQMASIHFALAKTVFSQNGYHLEVLPEVNRDAIEEGLRYVNNDACYPAIVVVGQLIQALKSGKYDLNRTALLISQTCGGCRSTNYATFLKIAVLKAGFGNISVAPFNVNLSSEPNAEGISMTPAMSQQLVLAFFIGDLLMRTSNHCRPYEKNAGATEQLVAAWIERAKPVIAEGKMRDVSKLAPGIIADFEALELVGENSRPKVGIVGEILLKYHEGANNRLIEVIEREGGEAVVPDILDFALYCLTSDWHRAAYSNVPMKNYLKSTFLVWLVERHRKKIQKRLEKSERFSAMCGVRHLIKKAETLVSTCNQTGEGWLLAADMVEMMESGVRNIICVQPFGCLPNHIVGKGLVKELRNRYSDANISALDFDPGATEVNQLNRIKLMMAIAVRNQRKKNNADLKNEEK